MGTGGTAIEKFGAKAGVKWGACNYGVCRNKDLNPHHYGPYDENELPNEISRVRLLPWHTPLHWLKENPFAGSKTFTVIRNPYDRVVSEYYSVWDGYYQKNGCDNHPQVMAIFFHNIIIYTIKKARKL